MFDERALAKIRFDILSPHTAYTCTRYSLAWVSLRAVRLYLAPCTHSCYVPHGVSSLLQLLHGVTAEPESPVSLLCTVIRVVAYGYAQLYTLFCDICEIQIVCTPHTREAKVEPRLS